MELRNWPARIGVKPGDTVQLMADLVRMAFRARRQGSVFAPAELLDAFIGAVGPEGHLLVPTFNFDLVSGDAFDVRNTPSISGALANAALRHPGFRRTGHPLHSFAVHGPAEKELDEEHGSSFGLDSPFGFLYRRHAALITLDLPLNDALTFAHFVEEQETVRYRKHRKMKVHYTDREGRASERAFSLYTKKWGHQMEFSALGPVLEQAGAMRTGEVDGTRYASIDLAQAYAVVAADIHGNKAASIHTFSWRAWLRDAAKDALHRLGFRSPKEKMAHAARTS